MLFLNSLCKRKVLSLLLVMTLGYGNYYFCGQVSAQSSDLNFKVYNPDQEQSADAPVASSSANSATSESAAPSLRQEIPVNDATKVIDQASAVESATPAVKATNQAVNTDSNLAEDKISNSDHATEVGKESVTKEATAEEAGKNKILQGYVRVVPTGTKMSIIMDTAVDSDTSQEGDEFSARTAEDLTIDGTTAVPAGSIIRGRIATLNAPRHLNRTGSVALKFDSVTTPDNRQIPLVANLVARGGVVHARRGIKDIAIDTGTFALPTALALGIGAVAGHSSSSVGVAGGALIGAGVGAAIGVAILMAKKGKRVDVRPGDELKIELAEDLHMPAM
jgi:hypothetical protein